MSKSVKKKVQKKVNLLNKLQTKKSLILLKKLKINQN